MMFNLKLVKGLMMAIIFLFFRCEIDCFHNDGNVIKLWFSFSPQFIHFAFCLGIFFSLSGMLGQLKFDQECITISREYKI